MIVVIIKKKKDLVFVSCFFSSFSRTHTQHSTAHICFCFFFVWDFIVFCWLVQMEILLISQMIMITSKLGKSLKRI